MRMKFSRGDYAVYCLLGSDTVHSVSYQPTFRRTLLQPSSGYSEQPTRRQLKQDKNLLLPLPVLRFSQRCGWGLRSSEIWLREWVIVPDASKQASGIFTLKIRKSCLETSGSDYPVTQATHRHITQDRNHQLLSLSLVCSIQSCTCML
jgi:hypothetical protein